VLRATPEELAAHEAMLAVIAVASGGRVLWAALEPRPSADTHADPAAVRTAAALEADEALDGGKAREAVGALAPLAEPQRPSA
jgi:hypothetical protein